MYKRDIPHLPETISRKEFVAEIFNLGLRFEHGCDTLITAVQIGDRFVSFKGDRVPYTSYKENFREKLTKSQINLIDNLVPQVYSKELAYVSCVISAGYNEDWGYSIKDVADELTNGYVYKMQWEISMIHNFYIPTGNFLINLFSLINYRGYVIGSMFWDLSRYICMDESLLYANPMTIIVAIIILVKHNRLRSTTDYRKRIFLDIMIKASEEYEIPLSDLLQTYITYKSP